MAFTPVFVSYHQLQVMAGPPDGGLDLYTIGDDLLQVTGSSVLTVLTGPHTGEVEVAAAVLATAPAEELDGWDAMAEATMWCPAGRVGVAGLMGDFADGLADLAVGPPGLVRLRVYARDRLRFLIELWPVDEDTGFRSVLADDLRTARWTPSRSRAAGWAMTQLVTQANPSPQQASLLRASRRSDGPPEPRARVFRSRPAPATADLRSVAGLVLPAGGVEVRLSAAAAGDHHCTGRWRWVQRPGSSMALPGSSDSHVELRSGGGELSVVHDGVRAADAIQLGLLWDHLLDCVAGGDWSAQPWDAALAQFAASVADQGTSTRTSIDRALAHRWGGGPPTERLSRVPANVIALSQLDRPLLDALAEAPPDAQRAVARWAARQACAVAGLLAAGWIAAALDGLDHGAPLPADFGTTMWPRMWGDARVVRTTIALPDGTPNASQQAIALPAVPAAAHEDPLAAAVDTVYFAALAHGPRSRELLASAAGLLAQLSR